MPRIAAVGAFVCLLSAWTSLCMAANKPPRPIIEDTYITAPRLVGGFVLMQTTDYTAQGDLAAGVGLRYHTPVPTLIADIYIYPAGGSETLDHAEATFRDSVQQASRLGLYSNVRWGDAQDYKLTRNDGSVWQGRLIPMVEHRGNQDFDSTTYLFHQGLYDYKLRADIPAAMAAGLPVAATIDRLLRDVLPAIQVVSVGSCGHKSVLDVLKDTDTIPAGYPDDVSPDGFTMLIHKSDMLPAGAASSAATPKAKVTRLIEIASRRQVAQGCTSLTYLPPNILGTTTLKLHYPADFWRSKPVGSRH